MDLRLFVGWYCRILWGDVYFHVGSTFFVCAVGNLLYCSMSYDEFIEFVNGQMC